MKRKHSSDPPLVAKIREAIRDLIDSEDATGCSEDLTVISKKAFKNLVKVEKEFDQAVKAFHKFCKIGE